MNRIKGYSSRTVLDALEARREAEQVAAEAEQAWWDAFDPDWEELSLEPEARRLVAWQDVAR
jgi:hypothetical protein